MFALPDLSPYLPVWTLLEYLLFAACLLTSISPWCRYAGAAYACAAVALALAASHGNLDGLGAFALCAFAAFRWACQKFWRTGTKARVGTWLQLVWIFAFFDHRMPGFTNWMWQAPLRLRADATLFSSHLSLDKVMVGSALLLSCPATVSYRLSSRCKRLLAAVGPSLGVVLIMIVPALLLGYVRFSPALHPLLPLWCVHNLILVVLPEEVLFRFALPSLLQDSVKYLRDRPKLCALFCALAFGVCHYRGGASYVVLASLAGVGYAQAARRAQGLQGAIFAHFALNFTHFVFFTYPAAQRLA